MNNLMSPPIRISTSELDRNVFSRDAGFYKLRPSMIAEPANEYDIISLFRYAELLNTSITFRTAGTSLSGQSVTNAILTKLQSMPRISEILNKGEKIKCTPGIIGAHLNRKLKSYNRIIGPDPASLNACMVGGIVANNSSGMRSGVFRNAYSTVDSIRFILPSGNIFDSSKEDEDEKLKLECPDLYSGLLKISEEINCNEKLIDKINEKYQIKNTVGYSLNSFVDFEKPIDILAHLLIGSEGTLAYISEVVFNTFPVLPQKLTGMIVFDNVIDAASAILPIRETGVTALEIIDGNSLKTVKDLQIIKELIGGVALDYSMLLFEYEGKTKESLAEKREEIESLLQQFALVKEPVFAYDIKVQEELWSIRKGLLPSLGASRTPGTTFILEDICFPLEVFPQAIPALQELFNKSGYRETGIYGHGMDGNLHFMLTQDFAQTGEIERYERFMNELADLVVDRFNGSMKAEHGTGRNIAPFVEREWGSEAYSIMKRIKELIDPDKILNPGVIINDDAKCHIKNIKSYPVLDDEVDKCIECGFCEPVCPTNEFTLSPRKRIIAARESSKEALLHDSEQKEGVIDTCVVDGLCSVACPVGINTGEMVKSLRRETHIKFSRELAVYFSNHFILLEKTVNLFSFLAVLLSKVIGLNRINKSIHLMRELTNINSIPYLNRSLGGAVKLKAERLSKSDFVYFPCCVSRMMGKPKNIDVSLVDVMQSIAQKAQLKLHIPQNVRNYCCGTAFLSKGYFEAFKSSLNRIIEWFWIESDNGRLPIVFDSSSCLQTMRTSRSYLDKSNLYKFDNMLILDSTEFISVYVIPRISINKKLRTVVLHPTCSSIKLSIQEKIEGIAGTCAENVVIPESSACCGMGGDRGLLFPDLTKTAASKEAKEVKLHQADGYYSSNIPCENAMTEAVGELYLSIAYLVDKVSD